MRGRRVRKGCRMGEEVVIVSIVFGSIVTIVALAVFHNVWKTSAKMKALRAAQHDEDGHLALLARLEERIEVLERIVTDEKLESRRRFREM